MEHGLCRAGLGGSLEADTAHLVPLAALDEVALEFDVTAVGQDLGPKPVVGRRQNVAAHAEGGCHVGGDLGESCAPAELRRAADEGPEVRVADPEPRFLAVALEHPQGAVRVAGHAPAAHRVDEAGQGVEDAVEVGADVEAEQLEVVASVDDDAQTFGGLEDLLEPVGQLRPARAAGEQRYPHAGRVTDDRSRAAVGCT